MNICCGNASWFKIKLNLPKMAGKNKDIPPDVDFVLTCQNNKLKKTWKKGN